MQPLWFASWSDPMPSQRRGRREGGRMEMKGGGREVVCSRGSGTAVGGWWCRLLSRNPRENFASRFTTRKAGCWQRCRATTRHRKWCSKGGQAFWPRVRTLGLGGYTCGVDGWYDAANDGLMIAVEAAAAEVAATPVAAMSNTVSAASDIRFLIVACMNSPVRVYINRRIQADPKPALQAVLLLK